MQEFLRGALAAAALAALACSATAGPLHDAAKDGDLDRIRQLIDDGADLNEQGAFGTALHTAAVKGDEAIALLLLDRGADPNAAKPGDGFTPLHVAAEWGHAGVVRLLLAHGANVNALGQGNYRMIPPLHLAETEEHTEVASLLREAGAAPAPVEPVAALLESADPERGRQVAVQCTRCHNLDRNAEASPFGPELYSVIGRELASVTDFAYYSPAIKRLGGVWSEESLNVFLAQPVAVVPGTTMVTDGVADPRERADLIAYLRTLGD